MTISLNEEKPKRRDKLVIMTEIIDIAKKGASKTQIMSKANLSFSQTNQYISILSQSSLLEKFTFNGKGFYKPTPKGIDFMEKQCQIIYLLNKGTPLQTIKTSLFCYIPSKEVNYPSVKVAQNTSFQFHDYTQ